MVYHVPNQTEQTQVVELNFFKMTKRNKRSYTVDHLDRSAPRLYALTPETTVMDVKRLILRKMRGIFESEPEDDEALNKMIEVHVRENLPMVLVGKYTRQRANCEYCGQRHGFRDEYCDLKIGDMEVNESVENSHQVTIG